MLEKVLVSFCIFSASRFISITDGVTFSVKVNNGDTLQWLSKATKRMLFFVTFLHFFFVTQLLSSPEGFLTQQIEKKREKETAH